ncbi:MAG TPA: AbrB/MazE/SpoVT family DNA-binding domain-containing protein, partial [Candidatus Hodarchaeales archaeon]|nr:AbrB/MazE/SpoVT family DNA-binding domain-containing protein [Candidatus Hodarchaeales archaeon]
PISGSSGFLMNEIVVGSKGELFLPKSLRARLGFNPGDRLHLEIHEDYLKIFKAPDLLELLDLPPLSLPQSPEEIERDMEEFQAEQIRYSEEDER